MDFQAAGRLIVLYHHHPHLVRVLVLGVLDVAFTLWLWVLVETAAVQQDTEDSHSIDEP